MSTLQPSSFSSGGLVATANSNVAAPTTDLMETKKQQQQIAQQQSQQGMVLFDYFSLPPLIVMMFKGEC